MNVENFYRKLEHEAWKYIPNKTNSLYRQFNGLTTKQRLAMSFKFLPFNKFEKILMKYIDNY